MKTEKFEEFVSAICKPRGIVPSREEWARMHELRARHVRFAIVLVRVKKHRYVQIVPEREDRHSYARMLSIQLRMGNAVLYVCYHAKCYVRVCSIASWAEDYKAIVPSYLRSRDVQVCECKPYKRKPEVWSAPLPRDKYQPTDYAAPKSENPYRRRCPNHGFQRTDHANRVMNRMVAF